MTELINPFPFVDNRYSIIRDPMDKRLYAPNKKVDPNATQTLLDAQTVLKFHQAYKGLGLAAPQIGINKQIIVLRHFTSDTANNDFSRWNDEIFLNPRILDAPEKIDGQDNMWWHIEGCMSHPGIRCEVARARVIIVEVQRLHSSKKLVMQIGGWTARIFQHEYDHIKGRLITDLGPMKRNIEIIKEGQELLMDVTKFNQEHGYVDPQV